jgi:outer membrane protein assembly factor BamA
MWSDKVRCYWLALLVLFSLNAFAKKPDTRRYPLEHINVNGSHRYSDQAIISALGLHVGQKTSQAELERLSAKLGNSGVFDAVEFLFGWGTNGVVATFNVSDSTNLVPIGFENLVWFSRNELATEIKKKLPLFTGVVPLAGDYKDQIAGALQQVLKKHHINGTLTVLPQGTSAHIHAMLYRVDGHEIKVTSCEFPGADHANKLDLFELRKYIIGMRYEKSYVQAELRRRLQDLYDNDGYLAAHFDDAGLDIVATTPDRTDIALTIRVIEGEQFHLGNVTWSGNTVYPSTELTAALDFPTGRVASVPKFRKALANIRRLYGKQGYIGVDMDFAPHLAADGTAQFDVKLNEGSQYTVGEVSITGMEEASAAAMLAEWELKAGDVYDASYPQVFMATKFGEHAPRTKWEWRNRETIHDETKTVDIEIAIEVEE